MDEKFDMNFEQGLANSIYNIKGLASICNNKSPYNGVDLKFRKNSFIGRCTHSFKCNSSASPYHVLGNSLNIVCEGTLPIGKFTVEDLAKMSSDYEYINDPPKQHNPHNRRGLELMKSFGFEKVITRIKGRLGYDPFRGVSEGWFNFFIDDNTRIEVELQAFGDFHRYVLWQGTNRFDRAGRYGMYNAELRNVNPNKKHKWEPGYNEELDKDPPDKFRIFVTGLRDIFQVRKTGFYSVEGDSSTYIPFESEQLPDIDELLFHMLSTWYGVEKDITYIRNVEEHLSKKEIGDSITLIVTNLDEGDSGAIEEDEESLSPFIVDKKINPASELYKLLISEKTKEAIEFMEKYVKSSQKKYTSLVDTLKENLNQVKDLSMRKKCSKK